MVLDGRRSPILKQEDATRYRSTCMRLSYLAKDRFGLAETAKHLAQRISESREFDFVPLKRAARYLVGKPKAAENGEDRSLLTRSHSCSQRFCWRPSLEEEHDGIGGPDWDTHCEIWIDASELDGIERWRGRVLRSGKRGQVGPSLRSIYQDLGIPMKVEIQSDSSTLTSSTERLGAGKRTKHIDTRYFWVQERVQDGDISFKKVPTAKNCADVGTKPVSASVSQQHCKYAGLVLTTDPTLQYTTKGDDPMMDLVTEMQKHISTERYNCQR